MDKYLTFYWNANKKKKIIALYKGYPCFSNTFDFKYHAITTSKTNLNCASCYPQV